MIRSFLLCVALFSGGGCAIDIQPSSEPGYGADDVVYQFIDAETMKPIEGAYVNPVWVTPAKPGKVDGSRCVQAALLRSDAQGWARMKAPKGTILDSNTMMVPGYEFMNYHYATPDARHVTHYIRAGYYEMENYPAWARMLEELGYQRDPALQLNPNKYWKLFPQCASALSSAVSGPLPFFPRQRKL